MPQVELEAAGAPEQQDQLAQPELREPPERQAAILAQRALLAQMARQQAQTVRPAVMEPARAALADAAVTVLTAQPVVQAQAVGATEMTMTTTILAAAL